ncbi:hypothetical protein CNR22_05260 [Sphingobacteriaceae bacterium]|nr:hypothetical protein CNR22_05260 [Sphingobacteriaceae bacterium]
MRQFLRINLFLSSILCLALVSCSPASGHKFVRTAIVTDKDVHPIVNKNTSLLYKAKIDLFNRHFSGLIVLKQLDETTSHLTFVTEIGMKMFDYEIRDKDFKLVYVFEPLNKPKITKLLTEDMKLILLQHLLNHDANMYEKEDHKVYKVKEDFRYYYAITNKTQNVGKIIKKGTLFKKVKVLYLYNDSLNASKIKLKHKGLIRLKIELNAITKTAS